MRSISGTPPLLQIPALAASRLTRLTAVGLADRHRLDVVDLDREPDPQEQVEAAIPPEQPSGRDHDFEYPGVSQARQW